MGISIPHTLVTTAKMSVGFLSQIDASLYSTGRDSRLQSVIGHQRCQTERRRTMAPKKKEKTLKRKNIITLKLTDIELELLQEAAEITGLSRSEYIRKLLLEKEIHHQIEVVADIDDLKKLVSEYGKIGSNLNQIAKYFNTGGSRSLAVENEIHQCIADLFQLRKEVLKLAGGKNGNRKTH